MAAVGLIAVGCDSGDSGDEQETLSSTSSTIVSDANNAGTAGFYFLAPFGVGCTINCGTFNGAFGGSKQKVEFQQLADCDGSNTLVGTPFVIGAVLVDVAQQRYRVGSNATTLGLQLNQCYRVTIKLGTVGTKGIGFSDLKVTSANAGSFVKVTPGSNVTVLWRIEGTQDTDGDTVFNHADNCPTVANTNQADTNNNGIGDVCDIIDQDNDGVPDATDNCPTVANSDQANADGDSAGDACETCDNDPLKLEPGNCGCGTVETPDTDGDGAFDCNEECDFNPLKRFGGQCGCSRFEIDADGNGTIDGCGTCGP